MKVKTLRLQNFRNHTDSTLDFQDAAFCVVRGANFSGKSSIAQALSMNLALTTTSLDMQGRGYASKIRRGETKSVITADIQGSQHLIQNVVTLNLNTSGRTNRATCIDDPDFHCGPFEKFLDRFKDALRVVLNTDAFLSLEEKEQKNLLAKLALPSRYDFPTEKITAVESAIGTGVVDFTGEPFAVIALAYKKLYDERSVVNRQVKDFVVPDPLPTIQGVNSGVLQGQLDAARTERQKLSTARDAAVSKAGELEVKRARLVGRVGTLETAVNEERKRLKESNESLLSAAKVKELTKVAEGKDAFGKLMQERNRVGAVRQARALEIARFEELPDAGTTCPTCDQVIDGEKLKALATKATIALGAAEREDAEILRQMKELGDVAGAIIALDAHKVALTTKAAIEVSLAEKEKQLKAAQDELSGMAGAVDATGPFTKPLAEIETKIDKLLSELRPVIAAEERAKEIKTRTEQLKRLQAKAAAMDALVEYFGKDGIKARLLAEHIGAFENKINETMTAWGYKAALSIDPYRFEVTDAKGVTNPVSELSGAERVMFSLALQCAVSRSANIGLVVIDEVAMFLPEIRPVMNQALYRMVQEKYLEQVIMLVADTSETVPKLPGSAFFMVKDGTVARLK